MAADHQSQPGTERRCGKWVKGKNCCADTRSCPELRCRISPKAGPTAASDACDLFFEALKQSCPVPIEFEQIEGGAKGYFHTVENRIAIQEGMSQVQIIKTAIHEMTHQKLHSIDPNAKVDPLPKLTRNHKEVEAESVAFTVCQHYGIDTGDYAIIKRDKIETFDAEHRKRIRKDVFEKWCQGQNKYRTTEDRKRDNVLENQEKQPPLMVDPDKQSYGVREAAMLLRCTEQEIRRMIRAGELEAGKYGNRYLIARSEIEWWILQQKLDTER